MKKIKASEFKSKCLALMDEVAETNESIVITKNGRPVSRLVAYLEKPETLFGLHRKELVIHGDVVSQIENEWEASGGNAE